MLSKLVVLLPGSCEVPEISGGGSEGIPFIKKEGSLDIIAAHGDKTRPYHPVVYSIDVGGEVSNQYHMSCILRKHTFASLFSLHR